jgi:hypothetical protein
MEINLDAVPFQVANDVLYVHPGIVVDYDMDTEKETHGELHVKLTHEGLILDLVKDGEVIGTYAQEYSDLANLCVE